MHLVRISSSDATKKDDRLVLKANGCVQKGPAMLFIGNIVSNTRYRLTLFKFARE